MSVFAELLCNHGDGAEARKAEAQAIADVAKMKAKKARRCAALLQLEALRWEYERGRRDLQQAMDDFCAVDQFSLPGVE